MSNNRQLLASYIQGIDAPRNFILNPKASKNTANVTDASAITTRDTVNTLDGVSSFRIDATASGQKVLFLASAFTKEVQGKNCEARFDYFGDASLYKAYIQFDSTVVSTESQLTNVTSGTQGISFNFPCYSSGSAVPSIVIESTSASAAAFNLGNFYIGEATNVGEVAQTSLVGTINWAIAAGCVWSWTATTAGVGSGIDAQCPTPTTTGNISAISSSPNSVVEFRMNAVAGRSYMIVPEGQFVNNTSSVVILTFYFTDGSVNTVGHSVWSNGQPSSNGLAPQIYRPTTSGTKTISLFAKSNSATINAQVYNQEGSGLRFSVYEIPSASEEIFKVGAPGLEWSAFTPTVTHGSGGATNVTHQGWYRCDGSELELKYQSTFSNTSAAFSVWYYGLPSGFTALTSVNNDNLGTVRLDDAGTAAFSGIIRIDTSTRLLIQYQAISTHSGTAPLLANQNLTNALPFTWTTSDLLTAYARVPVTASSPCPRIAMPLLKQAVTTSSAGIERIERVKVATTCTSTPCTITNQSGGISSVTRGGGGNYTVNFVAGTFSQAPTCNVQTNYLAFGSFRNAIITTTPTTSSFSFNTFVTNTAVAEDSGFDIICMGPR